MQTRLMDASRQPCTPKNATDKAPPGPKKPKLTLALFLIAWTDGYAGERMGEADNPGHGRRGPKGRNQRAIPKEAKKEHIWLRSHNVGPGFRAKERREETFNADIDIYALQETSADIKPCMTQRRSSQKSKSEPYGANQWTSTSKEEVH